MSFSSCSISQSAHLGVTAPVVHKARSVAGVSGGFRVSSAGASFKSSGIGAGLNGCENVIFQSNEKETMQKLNDRLANYLDKKLALEGTLSETEARYRAELHRLEELITRVEYKRLLDIKTRLGKEIATYRRLLEGEDDRFSSPIEITQVSSKHETISSTTVKKVTAVVTEIVDGKVVSSKVEKVVERS